MTKQADRFITLMERIQALRLGQPPLPELDAALTWPQMALLGHIIQHPGSRLQELAEAMGITAPSASVGVRKLEESGWLERKPDPGDKRAACIYPTKKTMNVYEVFEQYRKQSMIRFLAGLADQEQVQMLDLFEKAVAAAEAGVQEKLTETQS